ncbi:MAG: uroporphyrinogen decarboxylase family protein [Candidatus Aminicenantes bacterium]
MPKETMTPLERWQAVLARKKPDRIPMDYWATTETTRMLMKHLGCATKWQMFKKLHVDFLYHVEPEYTGPKLRRNHDVFGCRYRRVRYSTGVYEECMSHPLAGYHTVEEIEKHYRWPDPDWWDYGCLPQKLKGKERYPVAGGAYEPFLLYKKLRGEEQAFVDLIRNPDIVHYCLEHLFLLGYEEFIRVFEQLQDRVLCSYVSEDMGAQTDLMISADQIRKFLLPGMRKMIDLAHQAGAYVFHHNDGSIRRIIPDMILCGIDILNPIQWRCGNMDRKELKRDFGHQVILHGGVDNQHTLPFGSVQDVKQEVKYNLQILGADGGYILAPCHNIQPLTPVDNILAMYETGFEMGWT